MTADDIRACFREHYQYRFRDIGLFEFGISDGDDYFHCIFDAFMIVPDRQVFKGFEFKVSRSDFLADLKPRPQRYRDTLPKWKSYLKYCNLFYWVSPEGMIQPNEVEPPAGLVWITAARTKTGFLFCLMKRPQRINQEISIALQRRILFFFAARTKSRNQSYF
jgi:hypothetical protein